MIHLRAPNPNSIQAVIRAQLKKIRPTAPTEQPFQPPKRYACSCGAVVELDLLDPLPAGWIVVKGDGGTVVYRCAACARPAKRAAKKGRA